MPRRRNGVANGGDNNNWNGGNVAFSAGYQSAVWDMMMWKGKGKGRGAGKGGGNWGSSKGKGRHGGPGGVRHRDQKNRRRNNYTPNDEAKKKLIKCERHSKAMSKFLRYQLFNVLEDAPKNGFVHWEVFRYTVLPNITENEVTQVCVLLGKDRFDHFRIEDELYIRSLRKNVVQLEKNRDEDALVKYWAREDVWSRLQDWYSGGDTTQNVENDVAMDTPDGVDDVMQDVIDDGISEENTSNPPPDRNGKGVTPVNAGAGTATATATAGTTSQPMTYGGANSASKRSKQALNATSTAQPLSQNPNVSRLGETIDRSKIWSESSRPKTSALLQDSFSDSDSSV